ncbi:histone-lysine N-methyltransferase SETMAR [Alligator mississippiensis]|uniref:Histone-lysine N-methyltransferase SETMAR n=1 Tax=Alligator mississippiensis TaxID=8496 RepID=A0A151MA26_ALLMI|nr:histone-lysine N-methyltransferase SETMAR [Alligator mississippiensis]
MATQLAVCTKEEQRSVIRFLWAEGVPPSEIHRRIVAQYGKNCLAQRKVYEWVEKFKHGRTSVVDEPRAGRPNTATTEDNIAKVDAAVRASKRVSIPELVAEVGVSAGSIHAILHDHLNYQKVCARWVPKQLTDVHKRQRVEVCTQLLQHLQDEGEGFLSRIVTGDETWVHHYDPESKRQNMQWKCTSSPPPKKIHTQPPSGKVLLILFWDCLGPLLVHSMECAVTVNSSTYFHVLQNHLEPAIRIKRPGKLKQGVLLQLENVRPHSAQVTLETLHGLGFEILPYPPYSPDLAPSDYHMFGPLKEALRGHRFTSDAEVQHAVQEWLSQLPESFFEDGIKKLVTRWNTCVAKQGDYVEK